MSDRISSGRRATYMVGMLLIGVGFVLFLSTFYSAFTASGFGGSSQAILLEVDGQRVGGSYGRGGRGGSFSSAVTGMIMMIVGGFVRKLGARGVAGSGLVLDPDQAREDLAPYSRMAGGMAKDALHEAGIDLGRRDAAVTPQGEVAPVIMLRCKKCQKLNEEDSKFCQECGAPI